MRENVSDAGKGGAWQGHQAMLNARLHRSDNAQISLH